MKVSPFEKPLAKSPAQRLEEVERRLDQALSAKPEDEDRIHTLAEALMMLAAGYDELCFVVDAVADGAIQTQTSDRTRKLKAAKKRLSEINSAY